MIELVEKNILSVIYSVYSGDIDQLPLAHSLLGLCLQSRYMPLTGIQPGTLQSAGQYSVHWAKLDRAKFLNFLLVVAVKNKVQRCPAETGLARWIERQAEDWKVPGSILVKGMYLGCRHIPSRGCAGGSWLMFLSQWCFWFSLSVKKSIKCIF